MQVDILPLFSERYSATDSGIIKDLAASLRKRGLVVDVLNPEKIKKDAFSKARGQYDAALILRHADKRGVMAITGEDLFESGLNFVYGLGDSEGSAVVSWFRLLPEFYGERKDRANLIKRLTKESMHELGHTLGMKHCTKKTGGRPCVMAFSTNIHEVDGKGGRFCAEHSKLLD